MGEIAIIMLFTFDLRIDFWCTFDTNIHLCKIMTKLSESGVVDGQQLHFVESSTAARLAKKHRVVHLLLHPPGSMATEIVVASVASRCLCVAHKWIRRSKYPCEYSARV